MRRQLPPLNALRVFDVAARTRSFTQAAAELGLTHGAVSRQIALLESWLGHRLFVRQGRRMAITPLALTFGSEVSLAFDRIGAAAQAFGRLDTRRLLRVSAPTSFAMRWLIPRLPRFHESYPQTQVALTTVSTVQEELRGGFDVAVRRGRAVEGAWPEFQAVPILSEIDTLIMSPSLFERRPIRCPADVEGHLLIASETRPGDWIDWLEAAGLPHLVDRPRQLFDHFFVTRQAVEDGLGLGVGPLPLLETDVASGRLLTPLPEITVARTGYVALTPRDRDPSAVAPFLNWLVSVGEGRQAP